MSSLVRPSFFCSRPNGSLTPLIALDDLPAGITVRGISRILTPGETQGMISCGAAEPRSEPWTLEGAAQASSGPIANNEDMAELQAVLLKIMADNNVATHLRMAIKSVLYRSIGAPLPKAMTDPQSTAPVQHGNAGGNSGHKHGFNAKKEFCSYWIRHGECDYQQQGCLYKHEMPTDIFMLEKLGLRDIPRWYREKYNVPSLMQANYGNYHRGQHYQAAADQPAHKAIQHHPAADNASIAGPSVYANGITNAANKASTAGPSGHAHGNGNVAHNAGHNNAAHNASHKNTNANGNHHGPAHPRGGRYKSPRGAGFSGGKGRGNPNWGKNDQRNGVTPPLANNGNESQSPGNETPGTASPNTSNGSGCSISSRTQLDLLASPVVDPMPTVNVSGQHILDKDGMARKTSLTARLRRLTTEDSSPILDSEPEQILYRTKTRRVFNFGCDGDNKLAAKSKGTPAFDPFASLTKDETAGKATVSASSTPMIRELVATSEPINPNEPLINWGPIGELVERSAPTGNTTYAMALINGQAQTGVNGQLAYPYMGQH